MQSSVANVEAYTCSNHASLKDARVVLFLFASNAVFIDPLQIFVLYSHIMYSCTKQNKVELIKFCLSNTTTVPTSEAML
jgi:hypothetical protein